MGEVVRANPKILRGLEVLDRMRNAPGVTVQERAELTKLKAQLEEHEEKLMNPPVMVIENDRPASEAAGDWS